MVIQHVQTLMLPANSMESSVICFNMQACCSLYMLMMCHKLCCWGLIVCQTCEQMRLHELFQLIGCVLTCTISILAWVHGLRS